MGGRGSWSAGALGEIDVKDGPMQSAMIGGIIGSEETRGDISTMAGMAGFRDIDGTGDIPTGVLGAQMRIIPRACGEHYSDPCGN